MNELEEAEDALMEANVLDNKDAEVWGYLSLVCLKTGRKVEAEQSYKYAIKVRVMSLLRLSRIKKDLWFLRFIEVRDRFTIKVYLIRWICFNVYFSACLRYTFLLQLNLENKDLLEEIRAEQEKAGFGNPEY